ncbi:MAG: hypothetical protein K8R52_06370 [Bacteroidales bacterium]|nr:hypothetical protein [Bacteroidales bacterium]
MMKYSFILILLSAVFLSCEREISSDQADSFIKFYGNYLLDQAGDVEVLANGGYAICGTETSESLGKRMVLIVTDKYGNVRSGFPRYYAEEGLETGGSSLIALQDGAGGFFLSGFVERPVEGTEAVQKDIFLVRTSATGEQIWQRSYGSVENEHILHSIEMIRSGYMLAGYQVKNGKSDILVMGVTEEGDSIKLGLNYISIYDKNSTATFLLNTGEMYLCVCTIEKLNNEGASIQILTFDDELSPLVKNLSGEFDEQGMCIIEKNDGHFIVLGNRKNGSGISEMLLYGIETDGLLVTGSSLLATISEENRDLIGRRVVQTAAGNLAIAGTRRMDVNSEVLLQFVSSSHQIEEQVSYGASGAQTGTDIELSDDGGFVVLGTNRYGESTVISLMKTSATGDL